MTTFLFKAKKGKTGRWELMDFGTSYNEARLHDFLIANDGKIFRIEKEVTTRSLSQNKLYWMYLGIIERETGNSANDLHEYFRRTLLPPTFIKAMGKEIRIPKSTTDLKKHEFSEYLEKIAAETNIPVPDTAEHMKSLDFPIMK